MRRTKYTGNLILVFFINLIFNIEWSIPAWILLVLHFIIKIPLYWFFIALGAWILAVILLTMLLGVANKIGNQDPPHRENKNPYSKNNDIFK